MYQPCKLKAGCHCKFEFTSGRNLKRATKMHLSSHDIIPMPMGSFMLLELHVQKQALLLQKSTV